ncbi:hypothetical protein SBA3_4380005 [Candidatus Sulfopaludibacter sp. SbA3]|nr:hypothetical protein SBA3_4380005 [Candidatus Sulfopaludibacter sp. SbA3]
MVRIMSMDSKMEDVKTDCAGARRYVRTRRVDECGTLHELFTHCLPAFGGAYLRRIYQILDRAIGAGCPLTLAISGPVTVSGQHHTWLLPLLETGWVAYLSLPRRPPQPGRLQVRAHSRSLHPQRRCGPARGRHHPRHRHGF